MTTQRDASSTLRCHAGDSGADCLVGRASLRAGPTPCNSPGGDGARAEGRTLFAALSAGARGGLKARSAFRQRTPSAPHPTCTRHEPAPCPCLRSACHRPSPARQRSTRRQRRELLQGHPERRGLASLRWRARASRRRPGHRRARPPGRRGPGRRPPRCLAGLRAEQSGVGSAPRGAGTWRRPPPVEADAGGCNARTARTASHDRHSTSGNSPSGWSSKSSRATATQPPQIPPRA
jgi:hypothetical protein